MSKILEGVTYYKWSKDSDVITMNRSWYHDVDADGYSIDGPVEFYDTVDVNGPNEVELMNQYTEFNDEGHYDCLWNWTEDLVDLKGWTEHELQGDIEPEQKETA